MTVTFTRWHEAVTFTLENILDQLTNRLPTGLISAEAFASIKSVGRRLPNGITYGLGFESRLAEPAPEVDLILRPLAPPGLEIIAGLESGQQLPTSLAQDSNWMRVRDLCRNWATPGSILGEVTFCLWIELDSEQCSQAVPSPSLLFVQLQRPSCRPDLYERAVAVFHESIKGRQIRPGLAQNLRRCIELMPEKGLMTLLGLSIARPIDALRIVVGELEPDQIPEYVSSVGWKGRSKDLESLIFSLGGFSDRHSINFDLDEQGIGKVGIEFGIPQENAPTSDPRWELLLDFLVRQGWCRKEKRDGVLAWPKPLTVVLPDSQAIFVRRFISHVKLSLSAGRRAEAKAYVGLVW